MKRFLALLGTATIVATLAFASPAAAALPNPPFGRAVDGYAAYDGQDTCSPTAKPGVVGFRDLMRAEYGRSDLGITRPCSQGGTSEHKEGRALDYPFDVNNATQRAQATTVINWLLATDSHGNRHALARRFGIMYLIWNRQIWRAYDAADGWQPYSGANPHTDHIHFSFSWAGARKQTSWWTGGGGVSGTASVYGVLPSNKLTYTAIEATTGNRLKTVVSSAALDFAPVALATLNFNTLLATSPDGGLQRIDVITNNTSLTFNAPVRIGEGWSHSLLTYDGAGKLFGIANGVLHRYDLTVTKPVAGSFTGHVQIGNGFTLRTLTSTGPGWILGTTAAGALISYQIVGVENWNRHELKSTTWQVFPNLLSPGGGVIYAHDRDGAMWRYVDQNPFDGSGSDLVGYSTDPVDRAGWTQVRLSVQPRTVS